MRTNYVLIDYENKPQVDIDAIEKALPGAHVLIFVGAVQSSLPTDLVIKVQSLGDRGCFIQNKLSGKKNAVDMLIAMKIGELIGESALPYFHIVSADQDFLPLVHNLKERKIPAKCHSSTDFSAINKPRTVDEVVAHFIEGLPKATKPRKITTLRNAVKTVWGKHVPAASDVDKVIQKLQQAKVVAIDGEKVTYPDKPAK